MHIYEDARTVSRADLAAWLRQLASQLESGAQIFYGAAGAVTVADQVRCELEIEREDDREISVEIEFSWTSPKAAESTEEDEGTDEDEETDEDGAAEKEEPAAEAAEETAKATEAVTAGDGDDSGAASSASTETTPESGSKPAATA